jgi:hypothetical protein
LIVATACGSVLTGAAVFALFLVASISALDRDVPLAKAQVAAAFRSGQLVENPYQEGSTTIGSHQWNDCLITAMAIDQRGDRTRLALSPIIAGFPGLAADANPCAILKKLISGRPRMPNSITTIATSMERPCCFATCCRISGLGRFARSIERR